MECRHAYIERNIDYVLCDKEPKPNPHDRTELFHAVCGHQVQCPRENCHKLSSSWLYCVKLAEANQRAYDEVFDEEVSVQEEAPKKRTQRTRKPQSED